jgi:hypothetical protein
MRHSHYDMFASSLGCNLNQSTQGRGNSIEPFNPKSFHISEPECQKVNKALIFAKPSKSLESFFFAGLYNHKCLNVLFN